MKIGIIAVAILAVVGGATFVLMNSDDKASDSTSANTQNTQAASETTAAKENEGEAHNDSHTATTITYTDSGFSPATLTVKSGTKVTVTNNSSRQLEFSSDDHPAHTDNPELNQNSLAPGQSQTLTPTEKGSHGIHDHNDSSKKMTLIVE